MNKVRWQRESNGTCVPYMFEEINKVWAWRRYNVSKQHTPDKEYLSKGYASFIQAKNAGYELAEAKLE